MNEASIIKQDKSEDLTVDITTTQTDCGYVTTISIQSEDSIAIEEIKTASLQLAEIEHEMAVKRLIKKELTVTYFDRIDLQVRPAVSEKNPYLYSAANFNPMLPDTVE